ncbi:arsenical-resistance protein 2 [Cladorrhinum sp. PSN332]|nr:arsenical-resistance protein 2 [Cladorrhinum sp. PSN332]
MSPTDPQPPAPQPQPWHAAYPAPNSTGGEISRQEVLTLLRTVPPAQRDFVLVDLRRNDFEGGTIRGSINLPAQSLFPTLAALYDLWRKAGVKKVIFYCGSSRGRGSRATGWLADHIAKEGDDAKMESLALVGGIKGWAGAGGEYVEWMDEYDEKVWNKE